MKRLLIYLFLFISCSAFSQVAVMSGGVEDVASGGDNMLSNGTFDSTDDWTLGSDLSISGGVLNSGRASTYFTQTGDDMITGLSPSTSYTLTFDLDCYEDATEARSFQLADENWDNLLLDYADYYDGEVTMEFTTPSGLTEGDGLRINQQYTYVARIDNIVLTAD